jgi:hypothetical protein
MKRIVAGVTLAAGVGLALLGARTSSAFKPDEHAFGHTMIVETVLGSGYAYGNGFAAAPWSAALSDGRTVKFTSQAIDEVVDGVQAVDKVAGGVSIIEGYPIHMYGEIEAPQAHCDDDLVRECSDRILTLMLNDILPPLESYAATGDKYQLVYARIKLGRALHTLQDFYAHSNYSNLHTGSSPTQYFVELTTSGEAAGARLAPATSATCLAAFEPSLLSNTTWDHNGGNYQFTDAGLNAAYVTTGYFDNWTDARNQGFAPDDAPSRCDHGLEMILAIDYSVSGINKDAPYAPFMPSPRTTDYTPADTIALAAEQAGPEHLQASFHAAVHTAAFLTKIVDKIRLASPDAAAQDRMIAGFLGVDLDQPVIGFVIDTTGSMGDIIDGVKVNIQRTIDDASASNPSARFLVEPYGDPDVGTPTVGSAAAAQSLIATLYASGGDDCPELTQSGLIAALGAAPPHSKLIVYTDASSKDASLAGQVKQLALDKQIVVNYSVSGSCSPIDPTYYDVAAATGGQVLVTEHTSASVEASFIGVAIDPAGYSSRPAVTERGTISASHGVDVPVDSTATGLAVVATFDSGGASLQDPSGNIVSGSTPGVVVTDFLGGRGYSVKAPAAGTWRVVLDTTTTTAYSLVANVTSTFEIESVKWFEPASSGRSSHEGYMPYPSGPPVGSARLEVRLTALAGLRATRVDLVAEDGTVLGTPTLKSIDGGYSVGIASVPDHSFRVRVSGVDPSGRAFARIAPTLVTPRHFVVTFPENPTWVAGQPNTLRVRVANFGPSAPFGVSGTLAGAALTATPGDTPLATGAIGMFDLAVPVPASLAGSPAQVLDVLVTTGGTTEDTRMPIVIAADSDGDGLSDAEESGLNGGDPAYDGNGDGIPDRLQADVASLHTRLGGAYLTLVASGGGHFADVGARAVPLTAGATVTFPFQLVSYRIVGLTPGAAATVTMKFPGHLTVSTYEAYGTLAPGATDAPADFAYDGTTGATFAANQITLTYVDGKRGDADGAADGQVSTLGGPGAVAIARVNHTPADPPPSASSGGGCTTGHGTNDASLPLLALAALGLGLFRRRHPG